MRIVKRVRNSPRSASPTQPAAASNPASNATQATTAPREGKRSFSFATAHPLSAFAFRDLPSNTPFIKCANSAAVKEKHGAHFATLRRNDTNPISLRPFQLRQRHAHGQVVPGGVVVEGSPAFILAVDADAVQQIAL